MPDVSIRQALQYVADHPVPATDEVIELPVWELVSRTLFDIANAPDKRVRGSMSRATKAQKMVMDRLVGTRRAGSHPAAIKNDQVDFYDLTGGLIEEAK